MGDLGDPVDCTVVGAGLAGACAALWLGESERVLLLDAADRPAAGASGVAAGLVNPLMARKANPVWRIDEALDALDATLDLADAHAHVRLDGLLRPARDAKQAGFFRDTADALPHHGTWLVPDTVAARCPAVHAPHGALLVRQGGAADVPALVTALVDAVRDAGHEVRFSTRVTGWQTDGDSLRVYTDRGEVRARRLLLAPGDGFRHFAALAALPLHRIKGQTTWLARPDALGDLLPLSGTGYVVPDGDRVIVGSSYEHDFADLRATDAVSRMLRTKAAQMVPGLADAAIMNATAGVRVTVPQTRLPRLHPLADNRVWVFTGLGSKGLLMAPLLARDLARTRWDSARLPGEVRPG